MPPHPPQQPSAGTLQEAGEWLARAERDLQAGRGALRDTPPLPEMTAYHAQQAAEKAFKAFLTLRSTPFRQTHDLEELQRQCQTLQSDFAPFAAAAQLLAPYATKFRYPGGPLAPPEPEAQQALQEAEAMVRFVRQQL